MNEFTVLENDDKLCNTFIY